MGYTRHFGAMACAAVIRLVSRPPWNYDLMAAGYLLALAPTLLVRRRGGFSLAVHWPTFGGVVCAAGFFRNVVAGTGFHEPEGAFLCTGKAFYGLCALVPLCSCGAVGWEVLTRRWKPLQFALGVILLVWAMNSFAALWIRGNSAPTRVSSWSGCSRLMAGGRRRCRSSPGRSNIGPSNALARRFLASALNYFGQTAAALQQAEQAVELDQRTAPATVC